MLTLDTSAALALVDASEPHHRDVANAFKADGGPYVVPVALLGELAHMVNARLGAEALDAVLADIERGAFTLDCGEGDVPRIRELLGRYQDLRLGLVDASVVACAERNGGRVLTLDERDMRVVAREGTITPVPGW